MTFEDEINNFSQSAIGKHFVKFRANVAKALFRAVIKASPVGNPDLWKSKAPEGYVGGRFRANWMCSLNELDKTTTANTDQQGALTLVTSTVNKSKPGDAICLSNSLPYAIKLEYEGHSSQAPNGMVRLNVARFKTLIVEELAKFQ